MICPCGVNIKEHPHLSEICAPTLPGRLKKMVEWMDDWTKRQKDFEFTCLSQTIPAGPYACDGTVTAFPLHSRGSYGCRIEYEPCIDVKVLVGKYIANFCYTCLRQGRWLCPVTMSCKDICVQSNRAFLKESSLCILRCAHLSLDLRRLLYSWIRKTCTCLH